MLSNRIRVLAEGLFIILALLLGAFTIGSLLVLAGEDIPSGTLAQLRWQGTVFFLGFLLLFLFLLHHLLNHILQPLEQLPGYLKNIVAEENPTREAGIFPGSDVITNEANNLARAMGQCQLETAQEKRKLSLIMDNMDNGVALVDEEGNLLEGNKSFFTMFELERNIRCHETDIFHNIQFSQFIQKLLTTNQTGNFLLRQTIQGEQKVLQVFGAPLLVAYRHEPSRVLLVLHDITLLQKVYERQTAFVSNASHELATPLTTIKGFAETLSGDASMDSATRDKFLQIIVTESNRMQLLLKDLLQLAKLDSNEYRKNIVLEELHTEGILEELQMEFAQPAVMRNLHMDIQYGDKPLIKTNKEWVKQILVNLLENAFKYTPMGGTVRVSLIKEKGMAVFTVFNSGEGLREEDKEKIFARFYRADASHNHKIKGSGLGLSIVKFAVEMLGGTIHTESVPGQGVSFIFTMPLAQ